MSAVMESVLTLHHELRCTPARKRQHIGDTQMKAVLISVDNHTLGIQTTATVVADAGSEPILFYLPSHLNVYPRVIEERIMQALREVAKGEKQILIGFHLKELSYSRSLQLAQAVRREFGSLAVLVASGTHATSLREELPSDFDHVVVGSGEGIVPILHAMESGKATPRLIQKPPSRFIYPLFGDAYVLGENGHIVRARVRPLVHPQYKKRASLEIMLEVGCSYACSFCEVATLRNLFGRDYRILSSDPARSIQIIRDELEQTPEIEYLYFFDEDFLLKSELWIDKFARLYAEIRLPFFLFATPRSVSHGEAKLRKLGEVGLDTVNVGVQTGSARIARDLFGRKEDREEIMRVMRTLNALYNAGLIASPPMADFIILNPYETSADMEETFELMRDMPLPFEAVVHCMSFFRGTPLYRKALAEGVITPDYRFQYDLHDFVGRIKANEFKRDFTVAEGCAWLRCNAILCGMNGLHRTGNGRRFFGAIAEDNMSQLLNIDMSVEEIVQLAESLPDPMANVAFPWELPYL